MGQDIQVMISGTGYLGQDIPKRGVRKGTWAEKRGRYVQNTTARAGQLGQDNLVRTVGSAG